MKKSLFSALSAIQLITAAILSLFLAAESVLLYRSSMKDLAAERERIVETECGRIEIRLEVVDYQLKEILRSIMNNYTGLWSGNRGERLFDQQKLARILEDKVLLYGDIEHLFLYHPEDFLISRSSSSARGSERIALMEKVAQAMPDMKKKPSESRWMFMEEAGSTFCFHACYYEDQNIYVGAFVRAEKLFLPLAERLKGFPGRIGLTDGQGVSYEVENGIRQDQSGNLKIEQRTVKGSFLLQGTFAVRILEVLRRNLLLVVMSIVVITAAGIILQRKLIRRTILQPVHDLSAAIEAAGSEVEKLSIPQDAQIREVAVLESTLDELVREVLSTRLEIYENRLKKQDAELRQLRAQLRPHFYLNAIMTASTLIYQNRGEDAREYLNQLSGYMRYMMKLQESMVSLGEELAHVENYVRMQEIKFPDSVFLLIECPEELKALKVPHLLLHTIVENAFKHAMQLTEALMLMITCSREQTGDSPGLHIVVEDNGEGFAPEILEKYNGPSEALEQKDHIGLSNIKRSLVLIYGREGLIRFSNVIPRGARVEIDLPSEGIKG